MNAMAARMPLPLLRISVRRYAVCVMRRAGTYESIGDHPAAHPRFYSIALFLAFFCLYWTSSGCETRIEIQEEWQFGSTFNKCNRLRCIGQADVSFRAWCMIFLRQIFLPHGRRVRGGLDSCHIRWPPHILLHAASALLRTGSRSLYTYIY